ncbi:hypothetical protein D3C81_1455640 [compost metagenome]
MIDQAQRENIRHPVHGNALVQQLEVHVVDNLGAPQRCHQVHGANAILGNDFIKVCNVTEHGQALLALGTFVRLLASLVGQHTPQHPFAKPGVVTDFLIKEIGQVAVADNQGIVQARMRGKAFLQFTNRKVQEQLGNVTNDEQLHDQQP